MNAGAKMWLVIVVVALMVAANDGARFAAFRSKVAVAIVTASVA